MTILTFLRRTAAAAAALVLPALASAHTGDGSLHAHSPFVAGLLHPWSGVDHLAAMLAVGAWSALALQRRWLAPAAFVSVFTVGAVAGMAGVILPVIGTLVEPMIAASLLILGLLVATRRSLPLAMALGLSGLFAFFHGAAHGQELASLGRTDSGVALLGMVLSTATLHIAGLLAGHYALAPRRRLTVAIGGGVALLGTGLLASLSLGLA